MLLAVDCGNTHLVIGLFDGEKLLRSWRLSTDTRKTEDEYLVMLRQLLAEDGHSLQEISGMAVGSVVPAVNFALYKLADKYLRCEHCFVTYETDTGIPILMDNPAEVGADRIINAVSAHAKYSGPLIIVDFGTATTFDCITAAGEYIGGAICPGIEISQQALFARAAKLANIELRRPQSAVGKNTADCLRSGLLWGYGGQIDGLVRRMKAEIGCDATVIATGGLASFISSFAETIDVVDGQLTLEGLRMIWERVHR